MINNVVEVTQVTCYLLLERKQKAIYYFWFLNQLVWPKTVNVHLYSFQPQLQATFQQLMYFLVQFTSVVFMILM